VHPYSDPSGAVTSGPECGAGLETRASRLYRNAVLCGDASIASLPSSEMLGMYKNTFLHTPWFQIDHYSPWFRPNHLRTNDCWKNDYFVNGLRANNDSPLLYAPYPATTQKGKNVPKKSIKMNLHIDHSFDNDLSSVSGLTWLPWIGKGYKNFPAYRGTMVKTKRRITDSPRR
jgi:hypothetical protein